jgi:NAD(P)-dependent dehydrogenase (short-subunit alcohol dehydrogenase family)
VLNLNVKSPFFLTRDLLPFLDVAAASADCAGDYDRGFAPQAIPTFAYDTSKAAIHHLTRALAAKLARRPNGGHILVNAIAPGLVPTKMSQGISLVSGMPLYDIGKTLPLGRCGIWQALLFSWHPRLPLGSQASSFVPTAA